ncbi:MurR/RpiR family transcriptional regulator [Ciceribacter sp. L1K23]|uniref:MurR/RpiR family transcriptional regulator n=1 Tax=unclassified Ciceribacter TaxID=2628820 RepID=UPI001ABE0C37|nr:MULTISPECIES: MurR/RpiR family transcriptional regulator [unclassified Ciceribacter]MBO3761636.1 MurR/RpiR family transcriptional regulator [Ciceribacter sp. L1K22]MBR0554382.1 MurR/RpiR family transcriptional regulator [Ciceribacter sp. L1K23]
MTSSPERPASFDELCERLARDRHAMPKRLSQTAIYMVGHPDEVAFGTAATIAEAAGVQPSTLVRFAKSIGFDGFSDLQTLFRERLRDRNQSYEARLNALDHSSEGDEGRQLLKGLIAAGQDSLARLEQDFDSLAFERASTLLANAGTIYLCARRRAFPPLIQMRYAFAKLGIRSEICGSINGIDEDLLLMATPSDAAIVVSFLPYSDQTIAMARQLKDQGVPIAAITDSPLSPLVPLSEVCFQLTEADFAGFRTLAAAITLAMALTVSVADRRRRLSR